MRVNRSVADRIRSLFLLIMRLTTLSLILRNLAFGSSFYMACIQLFHLNCLS